MLFTSENISYTDIFLGYVKIDNLKLIFIIQSISDKKKMNICRIMNQEKFYGFLPQ